MTMKLGSDLTADQQKTVRASYVHRNTGEHTPTWVNTSFTHKGTHYSSYPLQFKDDAEWLANTRFAVNIDGSLDRRVKFCESTPTWPNNPELRNATK